MDISQGTSLYRYYDEYDVLLYAGITSRGARRNAEHFKKEWWQYVVRQEVEHFPSREAALMAESRTIRAFRPPFNTQQNPSYKEDRAAYLLFREASVGEAPLLGQKWFDSETVVSRDGVLVVDFVGHMKLELLRFTDGARTPKGTKLVRIQPVTRGARLFIKTRKHPRSCRLMVRHCEDHLEPKVVEFAYA